MKIAISNCILYKRITMVLSLDRWVGKVAVVTGASSGIGAGIAEFLADTGLIVVGIDQKVELVEEKAKQLSGKSGKLYGIKADVRKEEDVVKAFQWIDDNLGHVHILINCAGVAKETSLYNGDAQAWKTTLDVNVLGLCIVTKEAVKIMIANNINGHIIHINSVLGHKVANLSDINVYPASKHAVTALTQTLRNELNVMNSKIKVTSLSPGFVKTGMTTLDKNCRKERSQFLNRVPMLETNDIAEAVGYVLSTPENVLIKELTVTPVG